MFKKINWPRFPRQNLRDFVNENVDDLGLDLLEKMLEYEPSHRITATQALLHPYFKDVQLP